MNVKAKGNSKKRYLPAASTDTTLSKYLNEINAFPILTDKEELDLFERWKTKRDVEAAHRLVSSHLRIVPKIAYGYQGYGLPMMDLISEGNLGLMHAVKKFEPDFGYRFSTYAVWWVRSSIQDYILRSWSLVKISSSAAHKKLFFNFKKLKNKIDNLRLSGDSKGDDFSDVDDNQYIAEQLNLNRRDVDAMAQRLKGDASLNYTAEDDEREMIDIIECPSENQEVQIIERNYREYRKGLLYKAIGELNEREQDIIKSRVLNPNKPETLEVLSKRHNISKERVRQIEARAFEKIKNHVKQEISNE